MDTRESLLQTVIDDPENDTPRLVYADFLDESNEPADRARAELIRHQIETARMAPDHPERSSRIQQMVRFTDEYASRWFPWIRHPSCRPYPQRGFLESWSFADKPGSRDDLHDAFRFEPITSVTMFPSAVELKEVAHWSQLSRLKELQFWPGEPTAKTVFDFFAAAPLSQLRRLEYMGRRGTRVPIQDTVQLWATKPELQSLASLSVISADVGYSGARSLARSKSLTQLKIIGLCSANLDVKGMVELISSPIMTTVESVPLGGNLTRASDTLAFIQEMVQSPYLNQLKRFCLDETAFDDRCAEALAEAKWTQIDHVHILPRNINDSTTPTSLSAMSPRGIAQLVSAPWFQSVESLDLSSHTIGEIGAQALADAKLPNLRQLTLMSCGLNAKAIRLLVERFSNQLEQLQIYGNLIADSGARIIAAASWPNMVPKVGKSQYEIGLFLGGCGITPRGKAVLRESKTIPANIPTLFLGSD